MRTLTLSPKSPLVSSQALILVAISGALAVGLGCGDDTAPTDSGIDAAQDAGVDAGEPDTGVDAGEDSGGLPDATDAAADVAEDSGTEWTCEMSCGEDEMCCPIGTQVECMPATEEGCLLPDLTVIGAQATESMVFQWKNFAADDCALVEGCVTEPGWRRLLRFDTFTPNIGDADMALGPPDVENPNYEYSECHDHFHFNGYADYRLYDEAGEEAGMGHKQAFCLLDSDRYVTDDPTVATRARYNCGNQGIQRGWGDNYYAGLDCQWVDVTDVEPGEYMLRIEINGPRNLYESNYDNNTAMVPVTIAEDVAGDPTLDCRRTSTEGPNRDCSWELVVSDGTCTPGEMYQAGCGSYCGMGDAASCAGRMPDRNDPVLRVCEGTEACVARHALAIDDDSCGEACPLAEFVCPPSGTFSVMTAPYYQGQSYSCVVSSELVE